MSEATPVPIGTTNFDPGWTEGSPMRTYLGDPAVSASKLWKFHDETPADLLAALSGEKPDDGSPAKTQGDVAHVAVFESGDFHERYVVIGQCEATKKGDGQRCTNAGKVFRDGQSFCGTKGHDPYDGAPMADGVAVVKEVHRNTALAIKRELLAHPVIGPKLLTVPGRREATFVFQDPKTGLWIRIRPDQVITDPEGSDPDFQWSCINLKTTGKRGSPEEFHFPKDFRLMGHYFKAAVYRWGLREAWGVEPQHFWYPVAETYPPFKTILYRLGENWLDIGEAQARQALDSLAACVESGRWEGYPPVVHHLDPPQWQLDRVNSVDFIEVDESAEVAHV